MARIETESCVPFQLQSSIRRRREGWGGEKTRIVARREADQSHPCPSCLAESTPRRAKRRTSMETSGKLDGSSTRRTASSTSSGSKCPFVLSPPPSLPLALPASWPACDGLTAEPFVLSRGEDEKGRPYPNTWEPRVNCGAGLLRDWEERKARKERKRAAAEAEKKEKKERRRSREGSSSKPSSSVKPGESQKKRKRGTFVGLCHLGSQAANLTKRAISFSTESLPAPTAESSSSGSQLKKVRRQTVDAVARTYTSPVPQADSTPSALNRRLAKAAQLHLEASNEDMSVDLAEQSNATEALPSTSSTNDQPVNDREASEVIQSEVESADKGKAREDPAAPRPGVSPTLLSHKVSQRAHPDIGSSLPCICSSFGHFPGPARPQPAIHLRIYCSDAGEHRIHNRSHFLQLDRVCVDAEGTSVSRACPGRPSIPQDQQHNARPSSLCTRPDGSSSFRSGSLVVDDQGLQADSTLFSAVGSFASSDRFGLIEIARRSTGPQPCCRGCFRLSPAVASSSGRSASS